MNSLFDLLIQKPLSDSLLHYLLFIAFVLHMLFVLFALGTAMLAFYLFLETWHSGRLHESRWDREVLKTFTVHKSLAAVLGVAPLLLIQLGLAVPFFNGVTLFAPYWMLIILLLIISFVLFDSLSQQTNIQPYVFLILGIIALVALLIVPAIFVLVMVTAENPDQWANILKNGYHLDKALTIHWLFRYLHILGAALVAGGVFHFFFTAKGDPQKRTKMLHWIVAAILEQSVLGVLVLATLTKKLDYDTIIVMTIGIAAASFLLLNVFQALNKNSTMKPGLVFSLVMLIIVPMLFTRQMLQDKSLLPLNRELEANARVYEKNLSSYSQSALDNYQNDLNTVYDNGKTIFEKSCTFCHGGNADGKGNEAVNLNIQPEAIASIRANRDYIYDILIKGVNGTAMPYFGYYEKGKLNSLIDFLNVRFEVLGKLSPVPVTITLSDQEKADQTFSQVCSSCHGKDGRGAPEAIKFQPPPPDFTVYNLLPGRAFEVISNGYPGTMMTLFSNLPEGVRWGLVKIVNDKRKF
ncbi:MAG TPA: c-type cytochrome [Terriglobales bacterium]|nr:c-type cytochrome [Terriglobales bacterium]